MEKPNYGSAELPMVSIYMHTCARKAYTHSTCAVRTMWTPWYFNDKSNNNNNNNTKATLTLAVKTMWMLWY